MAFVLVSASGARTTGQSYVVLSRGLVCSQFAGRSLKSLSVDRTSSSQSVKDFVPVRVFASSNSEGQLTDRIEKGLKEAREISDKFGATSKEAASAWDAVEELEAEASHVKAAKAKPSGPSVFKDVMPSKPSAQPASEISPEILEDLAQRIESALTKARDATSKFGQGSKEAAAAWDAVEELEAEKSHYKAKAEKAGIPVPGIFFSTSASEFSIDRSADEARARFDKGAFQGPWMDNLDILGQTPLADEKNPVLQGKIERGITRANAVSEQFGSVSKEAAAAWDAVEELEAEASHKVTARVPLVADGFSGKIGGDPAPKKPRDPALSKKIEEAVEAARSVSAKFGEASKEAAAAWDAVEELDAEASHKSS
uniref:CP12 domain-containing protein n=1 Tax=Cyanoptyche gloeocystis TaxID=77922 RepID=A0A7S2JN26_9EUKA|eukprot:CAMPEP_0196656374 /NCGR_PEP_ID=MMETSP1086-20130531/16000_1 /TAXON_ID=77921 /ORGANISM="Cyanoptyche  gloeocystis , Strain SAG4.97" /LENGTH=369 /DNA_ID=CAMNT_0041989093 /DNA_START=84 /DNA_END=1193 /DNA_ORIENTATION=-